MSQGVGATIEIAQRLTAAGKIDDAIGVWRKLLTDTPEAANIYNTIGDLYLKSGRSADAAKTYLIAANIFKDSGFDVKSIAVYKKILAVDPARVDIRELLADMNADRGFVGNAVKDYLLVGQCHEDREAFGEALAVYQKCCGLDPQNILVNIKIARIYDKLEMQPEAITAYEQVLSAYGNKGASSGSGLEATIQEIRNIVQNYHRGALEEPSRSSEVVEPTEAPVAWTTESVVEPTEAPIAWTTEPPEVVETAPPTMEVVEPPVEAPVVPSRSMGEVSSPVALAFQERMDRSLDIGSWQEALQICSEMEGCHQLPFLNRWVDAYLAHGLLSRAIMVLEKSTSVAGRYGLWAEGEAIINQYLREDPNRLPTHRLLGLLGQHLESAGDVDGAVRRYAEAIVLVHERVSEVEARAYYEQVARTLPQIAQIASVRECLKLDIPEEGTSPTEETFEAPVMPVSQLPQSLLSSELPERTFRDMLNESSLFVRYGLYPQATEKLLMLSNLAPSREEPLLALKACYLHEEQIEKAVGTCHQLAGLYAKRGQEEKRHAITNEIAELDPTGRYRPSMVAPVHSPPPPSVDVPRPEIDRQEQESGPISDTAIELQGEQGSLHASDQNVEQVKVSVPDPEEKQEQVPERAVSPGDTSAQGVGSDAGSKKKKKVSYL